MADNKLSEVECDATMNDQTASSLAEYRRTEHVDKTDPRSEPNSSKSATDSAPDWSYLGTSPKNTPGTTSRTNVSGLSPLQKGKGVTTPTEGKSSTPSRQDILRDIQSQIQSRMTGDPNSEAYRLEFNRQLKEAAQEMLAAAGEAAQMAQRQRAVPAEDAKITFQRIDQGLSGRISTTFPTSQGVYSVGLPTSAFGSTAITSRIARQSFREKTSDISGIYGMGDIESTRVGVGVGPGISPSSIGSYRPPPSSMTITTQDALVRSSIQPVLHDNATLSAGAFHRDLVNTLGGFAYTEHGSHGLLPFQAHHNVYDEANYRSIYQDHHISNPIAQARAIQILQDANIIAGPDDYSDDEDVYESQEIEIPLPDKKKNRKKKKNNKKKQAAASSAAEPEAAQADQPVASGSGSTSDPSPHTRSRSGSTSGNSQDDLDSRAEQDADSVDSGTASSAPPELPLKSLNAKKRMRQKAKKKADAELQARAKALGVGTTLSDGCVVSMMSVEEEAEMQAMFGGAESVPNVGMEPGGGIGQGLGTISWEDLMRLQSEKAERKAAEEAATAARKAEASARRAEADAKRIREAAAVKKAVADARKAKEAAAQKKVEEAAAARKAELEAKRAREATALKKAEDAAAARKAEAEARRAEVAARKAEEEAKKNREAAALKKAEAEVAAKGEAEAAVKAKAKVEAEARVKAEAATAAKAKAEAEAARKKKEADLQAEAKRAKKAAASGSSSSSAPVVKAAVKIAPLVKKVEVHSSSESRKTKSSVVEKPSVISSKPITTEVVQPTAAVDEPVKVVPVASEVNIEKAPALVAVPSTARVDKPIDTPFTTAVVQATVPTVQQQSPRLSTVPLFKPVAVVQSLPSPVSTLVPSLETDDHGPTSRQIEFPLAGLHMPGIDPIWNPVTQRETVGRPAPIGTARPNPWSHENNTQLQPQASSFALGFQSATPSSLVHPQNQHQDQEQHQQQMMSQIAHQPMISGAQVSNTTMVYRSASLSMQQQQQQQHPVYTQYHPIPQAISVAPPVQRHQLDLSHQQQQHMHTNVAAGGHHAPLSVAYHPALTTPSPSSSPLSPSPSSPHSQIYQQVQGPSMGVYKSAPGGAFQMGPQRQIGTYPVGSSSGSGTSAHGSGTGAYPWI